MHFYFYFFLLEKISPVKKKADSCRHAYPCLPFNPTPLSLVDADNSATVHLAVWRWIRAPSLLKIICISLLQPFCSKILHFVRISGFPVPTIFRNLKEPLIPVQGF
jgi:hypothetical protein